MIQVLITSDGTTDFYPLTRPFWGRIRFVQHSGPPARGCFTITKEDVGNVVAEIGDYRTLEVPFIDVKKLSQEEVSKELLGLVSEDDASPSLTEMVTSFSGDMLKWASAKFARTTQQEINERLAICRACKWWDSKAYGGTGKCRKCGCSTWAKIRLKSSSCPIGLWNRIEVEEPEKQDTLVGQLQ